MDLEKLKAKYGTVHELTVPYTDGEGECTVYLKGFDREVYAMVTSTMANDELLATEMMLENLTVEGDSKPIIEDFHMLLSANRILGELFRVKESVLKKI